MSALLVPRSRHLFHAQPMRFTHRNVAQQLQREKYHNKHSVTHLRQQVTSRQSTSFPSASLSSAQKWWFRPSIIFGLGGTYAAATFLYAHNTTPMFIHISQLSPETRHIDFSGDGPRHYVIDRLCEPIFIAGFTSILALGAKLENPEVVVQKWSQRIPRFPSRFGAVSIILAGIAAVVASERICRNDGIQRFLGFVPHFRGVPDVDEPWFRSISNETHRMTPKERVAFQRERWLKLISNVPIGFLCVTLQQRLIVTNLLVYTNPTVAVFASSLAWATLLSRCDEASLTEGQELHIPIDVAINHAIAAAAYVASGRLAVPFVIDLACELSMLVLEQPSTLPFTLHIGSLSRKLSTEGKSQNENQV